MKFRCKDIDWSERHARGRLVHPCEAFARDALKVVIAQLSSLTETAVLMELRLVGLIFDFIFML